MCLTENQFTLKCTTLSLAQFIIKEKLRLEVSAQIIINLKVEVIEDVEVFKKP